jgi:hypothetical protein
VEAMLDRMLEKSYRNPANRRLARHLLHEQPWIRIFSMIRGSSKAERKRVEETKRQRWNIFDCFCSISLDKPPRLFYAELDEWPIRNQPG